MCTRCYQFRGPNSFNGLSEDCIPCQKAEAKWRRGEENKPGAEAIFSKARRERLEKYHGQVQSSRYRRYGLTDEQHAKLVEDCRGVCSICGQSNMGRELAIDHDHDTDVVRGLLCGKCNSGLGMFRDDPKLLRKAVRYLANPPAVACIGEVKPANSSRR